jgi:hypothetical protein
MRRCRWLSSEVGTVGMRRSSADTMIPLLR